MRVKASANGATRPTAMRQEAEDTAREATLPSQPGHTVGYFGLPVERVIEVGMQLEI